MVRQEWTFFGSRQENSSAEPRPRPDAIRLPAGAGLIISTALVALLWKAIVLVRNYPAFVLPAPELVLGRLASELTNGGPLPHHILITLAEALGGFGLALCVSLPLAYILAHAPRLERLLAPQLAASQAIPIVAVAPLIILWVGTGLDAKILVAAMVTFFPILSSAIVALRGVPRELMEMAKISGASRRQVLWYVELPLATTGIFGGVKTGMALATTGAVVAEFVSGRDGLGALINIARGLFDTPLMFVALLVLAALTLVFYTIAGLLERLLVRWEF